MITVKVYYQKCPECGQTWAARLSEQEIVRIGKEVFICKCNKEWPTGCTEWTHLNTGQRRDYFVSTAEIGVLLICTFIPPLFGYFISGGWNAALRAGMWGFLVGVVFVSVLWAIKGCIVGLSLRRCPAESFPPTR